MSQHVTDFFNDRKAVWLKAKLKTDLAPDAQALIEQEAEDRFSLANWLPDAAKRASQLSMVSHPSKFSHPSAKSSAIIAQREQRHDGYFRTGNMAYDLDVFGNAAAMDVYKFLNLSMQDGRTVLSHLDEDSEEVQNLMQIPTASYADLKAGLLAIKQSDERSIKTDRLLKQVFFPVGKNEYHLLSLLTPSGVLTRLKNTLDHMRFSDETKSAKEARRKAEYHKTGFDDVLNLTVTAYGGTQPQNVSVLNSQNAGRAYLLMSAPPSIEQREIRLPTSDFFRNSVRLRPLSEAFLSLHELMQEDIPNNKTVRTAIGKLIDYVILMVIQQAQQIRDYKNGWSQKDHYKSLPLSQRIWLDDYHAERRQVDDDWIADVSRVFARWLMSAYVYTLKNNAIKLGDAEMLQMEDFVTHALDHQEFFE
ncbi:type I-F CRISPR-associated protein Csy1 [Aquirhabdus sp.]|uniref:type I-F CRISPR-associated protein Csy1 n=1 Tax=Aquirhabdus sp. TaxID=2824160 RepID=UPI00396C6ED6